MILSGHSGYVVLLEFFPNPAISHCIPQHDAAVDTTPIGTPQMPEIANGPEIFRGQVQHPVYGACDHHVEIKIQQPALYVLPVKHLHLVPPGLLFAGNAGPILQDVLDHGGGYRTIVLSKHMESHRTGQIGCDHVMQSVHILPGVGIAMYHTGTVYGVHGYLPLLFLHRDIYGIIWVDK